MGCDLRPEDLEAYSAGEASPERAPEIAAHIQACGTCRDELSRIRAEDELLQAALAVATASRGRARLMARLGPQARPTSLSRALTMASAAVLLAAAAILAILMRSPSRRTATPAGNLAEAASLLESGDASEAAGIYEAAALELRRAGNSPDRLQALFGLGRARLAEGSHLEAWIAFEEVARRSDDEGLSARAIEEGLKALKKRVDESGGEFEKSVRDELERELERS